MKHLRRALGALLLFCLAIRTAASLLAPIMPIIIVLFVVVAILAYMLGWGSDL